MTFQITRQDIETGAAWTSHFYGLSRLESLTVEASYILTDRNKDHLDSPETKAWLEQFFPSSLEEAEKVKDDFHDLHDKKVKTEDDRLRRDAAYDEFISGRNAS